MKALDNTKQDLATKKLSQFIENKIQYLESADFQLWLQHKTPVRLRPLLKLALNHSLNYALDWIRPELQRHAYKVVNLTLNSVHAQLKLHHQNEISFSTFVSALEQSLKLFFNQHLGGTPFELEISYLQFEKRQKWDHSLSMKISFDEKNLDQELYLLQKNKFYEFENQVVVKIENKKNTDTIAFKIQIKPISQISYSKKGSA